MATSEPGPRVHVFPARRDAADDVNRFIEVTCTEAGVASEDRPRLVLLIEELFTNTVVHGHRRDSEEPVQLTLDVTPRAILVIYEDTAPPFNPFVTVMAPSEAMSVEQRPVGGLGIWFITKMAAEFGYAYSEGRNRITFRLERSGIAD